MPASRLGMCEVCDEESAKYSCPRCEVKTCSVNCVGIHKKELECNGVREKAKYKAVGEFTNIDLLNDYRLLEEMNRYADTCEKKIRKNYMNSRSELPTHLYRLRSAARRRRVSLVFLPHIFRRHKTSTTYLDYKTQELFWRIDWVFVHANAKFTDNRVIDTDLLCNILDKYLNPETNHDRRLKFYQAAGQSGVVLLFKAERIPGERYYELDPSCSIRENLAGKTVVEFPEIHVILVDHRQSYDILSPDEEEALEKELECRIAPKSNYPIEGDEADVKKNYLFSSVERDEITGMKGDDFTGMKEEANDEMSFNETNQ